MCLNSAFSLKSYLRSSSNSDCLINFWKLSSCVIVNHLCKWEAPAATGAEARSCEGSGSGGGGEGRGGSGGARTMEDSWVAPAPANRTPSPSCHRSLRSSSLQHPCIFFLSRTPCMSIIGPRIFAVGLRISCHAFLVFPPLFQFHFQLLRA